jgi:hypothetical protein
MALMNDASRDTLSGISFPSAVKHYRIRDFILVSPKYCFIVNEISVQISVVNALSSLKYFLP